MPDTDKISLNAGEKLAQTAIDKSKSRTSLWMAGQVSPGALLMEGDSWFDYPADDLPTILEEDYGYYIESVAHKGHTLESMAFDPGQINHVVKRLKKMQADGHAPKAILLSAGGNDVAGNSKEVQTKGFGRFLNRASSGLPPLNDLIFSAFLEHKMRPAYITWLSALNKTCLETLGQKRPIIVHGYDFSPPDGRGYNIFEDFAGPWIRPAFDSFGWTDWRANKPVVATMISKLNELLSTLHLVQGLENVIHLDLRGSLPNGADYKKWWANELHPTDEGFAIVAAKIHAALAKV
jgi:hypothetical protein